MIVVYGTSMTTGSKKSFRMSNEKWKERDRYYPAWFFDMSTVHYEYPSESLPKSKETK